LGEVPIFLREGLILHRKSPGFFWELIERGGTVSQKGHSEARECPRLPVEDRDSPTWCSERGPEKIFNQMMAAICSGRGFDTIHIADFAGMIMILKRGLTVNSG